MDRFNTIWATFVNHVVTNFVCPNSPTFWAIVENFNFCKENYLGNCWGLFTHTGRH